LDSYNRNASFNLFFFFSFLYSKLTKLNYLPPTPLNRMDFATLTRPSSSHRSRATPTWPRATARPSSWRSLKTGPWPSTSTPRTARSCSTATASTTSRPVVRWPPRPRSLFTPQRRSFLLPTRLVLFQATPWTTWITPCWRWDTARWAASRTGWWRTRGPRTGATTATSWCRWRTTTVASPLTPHTSHWRSFAPFPWCLNDC